MMPSVSEASKQEWAPWSDLVHVVGYSVLTLFPDQTWPDMLCHYCCCDALQVRQSSQAGIWDSLHHILKHILDEYESGYRTTLLQRKQNK